MTRILHSPDAQATMLLVGRFGQGKAKPLSRNDFNKVAHVLHERGMRPSDLFGGVPEDLPVPAERIADLISRGTALALSVENWGRMGISFVSRGDARYPSRYKRLLKGGASPVIYFAGDLGLLDQPTLGVVGSRDATEEGVSTAVRVGEKSSREGVVIVSGDARGIDRAAMEAALDAGGRVIGVLADSLGKAVLSKRYRQAISDGRVLLISHKEPEARFTIAQAMERNRYIYAACDAVLISDSATKGGTWNGAIENNRHRWSPAYVRTGGDNAEGRSALVSEGVLEFSTHWLEEEFKLTSLFVEPSTETALPLFAAAEVGRTESEVGAQSEGRCLSVTQDGLPDPIRDDRDLLSEKAEASLFKFFVKILSDYLVDYKGVEAISSHFNLYPEQAAAWLDRAVQMGRIEFREGEGWRVIR